ncbi:MAG: 2-amino-4-hydroxy-6-hydroxymethyldihydropteridine diphosphokinase [Cyclobacteriaceae bacterium]
MHRVVLGIGGNLGNREALLKRAERMLSKEMSLMAKSGIYESEAWGGNSTGWYLNRVLIMESNLEPFQTLDFIQSIENRLGRRRGEKWGNRTMDIDILYFDDQIIHTDRLKVPHPQLEHRNFVLAPLAELLPDYLHPEVGRSHKELLNLSHDPLKVRLLPDL